MDDELTTAAFWNVQLQNYRNYEYHELTIGDLKEILEDEWSCEFNGIFIGRDRDCTGQLGIFFRADSAYVAYEDFDHQQWWCSYNLAACDAEDWNELVRLTPDDAEDFTFRKCSIISKQNAWQIVEQYLLTGSKAGLHRSGNDGKPEL